MTFFPLTPKNQTTRKNLWALVMVSRRQFFDSTFSRRFCRHNNPNTDSSRSSRWQAYRQLQCPCTKREAIGSKTPFPIFFVRLLFSFSLRPACDERFRPSSSDEAWAIWKETSCLRSCVWLTHRENEVVTNCCVFHTFKGMTSFKSRQTLLGFLLLLRVLTNLGTIYNRLCLSR